MTTIITNGKLVVSDRRGSGAAADDTKIVENNHSKLHPIGRVYFKLGDKAIEILFAGISGRRADGTKVVNILRSMPKGIKIDDYITLLSKTVQVSSSTTLLLAGQDAAATLNIRPAAIRSHGVLSEVTLTTYDLSDGCIVGVGSGSAIAEGFNLLSPSISIVDCFTMAAVMDPATSLEHDLCSLALKTVQTSKIPDPGVARDWARRILRRTANSKAWPLKHVGDNSYPKDAYV